MEFECNYSKWKIEEIEKKEILKIYKEEVDEDGSYCFGLCKLSERKILINKDMCLDQKIRTLRHELTHCYVFSYGLYYAPNFNEEMLCDIVASTMDFVKEIETKYRAAQGTIFKG